MSIRIKPAVRTAQGAQPVQNSFVSPKAPSLYRWDNWPADLGHGHIARFSLEAPKTPHDPNLRHGQASIGVYLPSPTGFNRLSNVVNGTPSWSGSAANLSTMNRESDLDALQTIDAVSIRSDLSQFDAAALQSFRDSALLVPFTLPYRQPPLGFANVERAQRISLAYKKSGELEFKTHGVVLDPYVEGIDPDILKLYHITDSAHCISAWRDPFVFYQDGQYHMLFAARYSEQFFASLSPELQAKHHADSTRQAKTTVGFDEEVNSTVGYATSTDLAHWTLQRPLALPANAAQFELPSMTQTKDGAILTVCVSNGAVGGEPDEAVKLFGPRHQYLLAFRCADGVASMGLVDGWASMENVINRQTHPLSKIYGPNFLPVGDHVLVSAFDEATHENMNIVRLPREGFPQNIPSQESIAWEFPSRASKP
jgi:hypothetical protein